MGGGGSDSRALFPMLIKNQVIMEENEQESSVKMIFFNKRAMKKITKCSTGERKNAATIMNNCSMRTI